MATKDPSSEFESAFLFDFEWMPTDYGEWFNPNFGFVISKESEAEEVWIAVPIKAYGKKPLPELFPNRDAAINALIHFIKSQPRPYRTTVTSYTPDTDDQRWSKVDGVEENEADIFRASVEEKVFDIIANNDIELAGRVIIEIMQRLAKGVASSKPGSLFGLPIIMTNPNYAISMQIDEVIKECRKIKCSYFW